MKGLTLIEVHNDLLSLSLFIETTTVILQKTCNHARLQKRSQLCPRFLLLTSFSTLCPIVSSNDVRIEHFTSSLCTHSTHTDSLPSFSNHIHFSVSLVPDVFKLKKLRTKATPSDNTRLNDPVYFAPTTQKPLQNHKSTQRWRSPTPRRTNANATARNASARLKSSLPKRWQ